MSFYDLKNFTEMMRVLGYPRLISLSNFQYPNFPLVAEILLWLVKRFDNDVNVPNNFSSEEERIALVHYVAEFMMKTVNIRLNIKRLYMADAYAVQELLKMTSVLYKAQLQSSHDLLLFENQTPVNFDISDRLNDFKMSKQLTSQLTISGATLYDLLGKEDELSEIRNSKITGKYDTSEIEVALQEIIANTKKEIEETKVQIENVKDTEQNLDVRIERRKTELERNQKRLETLRKMRPPFMEEFEKLEVELKQLYNDYLQKFRYLAWLEYLYEDAAKVEQERFERRQAAAKKELEQLYIDNVNIDGVMDSNDSAFMTDFQNPLIIGEGKKKSTEISNQDTKKSARVTTNQRRLYGSMSGRQQGISDNNKNQESSDSDSDLLIDNIDDDEYDEDLLNSVDMDIKEYNSKGMEEQHNKVDHTDDEF